jgi:PAS domain S-box-containing protein
MSETSTLPHATHDGPSAPPSMLVVDDNPATRYSTSRVLKAAGYVTTEASTGQDALTKVGEHTVAVILDVNLPDMDGFEVCRELRARPETARVPVIHLSATYIRDTDKIRGLHSGADAYMTHPAEPALLVATVQALVRARTAEDAMRRSETRFKAIYEQALSGICLIDEQGRLVEVNPAMQNLLKRDPTMVLGHLIADFVPDEWVGSITHFLEASRDAVWRGEFPLLDADGRIVHMSWSVAPNVEPGLSLAIGTNISDQVKLDRQREELLDREQAARVAAERTSRSKDEFIAVLSHELRTPLNAILNWVHVLQRADSPATQTRGLDAIERNARIQTRLISDILDVSRMDLGKLRLEEELVDPVELVTSSVSALGSAFREKAIRVTMRLPDAKVSTLADAARFQQIVWNLLTNSIKFSRQGGTVEVELKVIDAEVHITVRDEGQGIKPEFLPYLFDRFTQSDSATNRYHGGLGLGLSIVKHLVELHGGTITAHSEGTDLGACFHVVLPVRQAAPVDLDAVADQSPVAEDTLLDTQPAVLTELGGLTVLAVEDDNENREVLGMILRDRGAHVVLASDYASCLAAMDALVPDVLVSDIGMPGKDGYALIDEVRKRELAQGRGRTPAIALTAFAREQDREKALKAGFDAYFTKPLKPNELLAAILRLTDQVH